LYDNIRDLLSPSGMTETRRNSCLKCTIANTTRPKRKKEFKGTKIAYVYDEKGT